MNLLILRNKKNLQKPSGWEAQRKNFGKIISCRGKINVCTIFFRGDSWSLQALCPQDDPVFILISHGSTLTRL